METKKFTTEISEYAYLKQWLTHKFPEGEESKIKKARFAELCARISPTDRDLKPFNESIGRMRAATLSHLVKELFSVEQRILLDREVYRRIDGNKTIGFKFYLLPALPDPAIIRAKNIASKAVTTILLNHKREGAPSADQMMGALKTEILDLLRENSPQAMVSEILASAKEGKVDISVIMEACYKFHPDFPVDKIPVA